MLKCARYKFRIPRISHKLANTGVYGYQYRDTNHTIEMYKSSDALLKMFLHHSRTARSCRTTFGPKCQR